MYLGYISTCPTGVPHFPLNGQDEAEPVGPEHQLKTRWELNDDLLRYGGEAHAHTIAPNGSGKSRKVILPNLFRLTDWSIAVLDPKAELLAHTALHRAAAGSRVMVYDPLGVVEKTYPELLRKYPEIFKSRGFNPLAGVNLNSNEVLDTLRDIANAMIRLDQDRDTYWAKSARALLAGLMMALLADGAGGAPPSLNELRTALGLKPDDLAKLIAEYVKDYGDKYPALKAMLSEFVSQTAQDRELSGIRRTTKTETVWLDSPKIQADLVGEAFDFKSIKRQPTTLYIVLPPGKFVDYAPWMRLVLTSILLPLLESTEDWAVPTLFMLDEVAQLGQMEVIQRMFPVMRQYGVKLWMFWQSIGQMEKNYGDAWSDFISNAGIVQAFSPDKESNTREYLSRMGGERPRRHKTVSKSSSYGFSSNNGITYPRYGALPNGTSSGGGFNSSDTTNTNEQIMNERVVKAHEIAALDRDETIVFSRMGKIHLTVCPQPELLPGIKEAMNKARAEIAGGAKPPLAIAPPVAGPKTALPVNKSVDKVPNQSKPPLGPKFDWTRRYRPDDPELPDWMLAAMRGEPSEKVVQAMLRDRSGDVKK